MAGRGPAPSQSRQRSGEPTRGEWKSAPGVGWQQGDIPGCPLRGSAALTTWGIWMRSWYASHWTVEDLPNLRLVIKLWAKADAGKANGSELNNMRLLMEDLGITRKGQQERRWRPPEADADAAPMDEPSPYGHLRVAK